MTGLKMLVAAVLVSTISATSALAQQETAFAAMFPNRDPLNGGALTPAGRMGLELPGGAAGAYTANNAYAGTGSASPSIRVRRYHSYDPATGTFLGSDGRRHPSR